MTWTFRLHAISALLIALLTVLLGNRAQAQDVRSGVEQLAGQIVKETPDGRQLRIAVADFPDLQGVTSDLGRYIASRLTTRLAQSPKFFVIERQRLGQVLAELKFSMSDLVDPSKAKQFGRMAGVEAIIVGAVSDVGNQFDFDARMIDIETSRTILGATVAIAKDPAVDDMNKRGRQEVRVGAGPGTATSGSEGPHAARNAALKGFAESGFTFQPEPCRRGGGDVLCMVTITNGGNESKHISFTTTQGNLRSRMLDPKGNQYDIVRVVAGSRPTEGYAEVGEHFPAGLSVRVGFVAKGVPDDVPTVNISLALGGQLYGKTIVLREVPIAR